jgi:hypothetical protein
MNIIIACLAHVKHFLKQKTKDNGGLSKSCDCMKELLVTFLQ